MRVALADVEVPGGSRFEHHVVRSPREAVGTIVANQASELLLLWRHRFITDTWGWEIPAGAVEAGEDLAGAARRETLEETGWTVTSPRLLVSYNPMNGICDQRFHLFTARDAERLGEPVDTSEAERVEWVPLDEVTRAMRQGDVSDGLTLTALAFALAFDDLG